LSKVPNCKDAKIKTFENLGPGVYEKDFGPNSSTVLSETGHKRTNSDSRIGDSEFNSSTAGP
jgi:hypothetical protein